MTMIALAAAVFAAATPIAVRASGFEDATSAPALRLGRLGHDFANQHQCFPADAMFQIAFNESGNVHYLIARADCYAATGNTDLAREGFVWARDARVAMSSSEQGYIERTLARLGEAAEREIAAAETRPIADTSPEPPEPNGYFHASALYRTNDTLTPPVPQADLSQPHYGAEWGWFPLRGHADAGDALGLFVRAFGTMETDSAKLDDDSLQAGVGLRLKPFRFANLALRGERLIPIGDNAREGWMLSASHDWGVGGEWRSARAPWVIANTWLDASWLPEDPDYVSARGETFLGAALPLGERLALIPHGVAAIRYSEETGNHQAVGEAGLGVGVRYWFDPDDTAPGSAMDLLLQYRWFVLEDTTLPLSEDGTWVGRIVVRR